MAEMNDRFSTTFKMKDGETTLAQYCVAVLDTAAEGGVKRPAGAGAGNIAGVLRDTEHEAGKYASYQVAGIAKVTVSEAVAVGDMLIVADVQGRVKPKGTGAHNSGVGIVGRAISPATTAGSLVKVILTIPDEYSS